MLRAEYLQPINFEGHDPNLNTTTAAAASTETNPAVAKGAGRCLARKTQDFKEVLVLFAHAPASLTS